MSYKKMVNMITRDQPMYLEVIVGVDSYTNCTVPALPAESLKDRTVQINENDHGSGNKRLGYSTASSRKLSDGDLARAVNGIPSLDKVVGALGRGGMGVVYRAEYSLGHQSLGHQSLGHQSLGHQSIDVALKLSLDRVTEVVEGERTGERAGERARSVSREAMIMKKLGGSEYTPAVYESGQSDGRPYLIMGLSGGKRLDEAVRENKFTLDGLYDAMKKIAEAFSDVHARGVIHNDVKPGNILVTLGQDRGEYRVTKVDIIDYGVSKVKKEGSGEEDGGVIVIRGTPRYMAPERLVNCKSDERSDIYALGATFREMIVGTPPYEGTPSEVIRKQYMQELYGRVYKPVMQEAKEKGIAVKPEIARLIDECVNLYPDQRPQTMEEVRQRLMESIMPADSDRKAPGHVIHLETAVGYNPPTRQTRKYDTIAA